MSNTRLDRLELSPLRSPHVTWCQKWDGDGDSNWSDTERRRGIGDGFSDTEYSDNDDSFGNARGSFRSSADNDEFRDSCPAAIEP